MMTRPSEDGDAIRCSFCQKYQEQVRKMVAGPDVYICDECVGLCHELIADEVRAS
jgi:ATP-dependent Clp protease ATP-binding subunit ClpX